MEGPGLRGGSSGKPRKTSPALPGAEGRTLSQDVGNPPRSELTGPQRALALLAAPGYLGTVDRT